MLLGALFSLMAQNVQTHLNRQGTQVPEALTKLNFKWFSFWSGLEALQLCKKWGACLLFPRMVQTLLQLAVALEVKVAWVL